MQEPMVLCRAASRAEGQVSKQMPNRLSLKNNLPNTSPSQANSMRQEVAQERTRLPPQLPRPLCLESLPARWPRRWLAPMPHQGRLARSGTLPRKTDAVRCFSRVVAIMGVGGKPPGMSSKEECTPNHTFQPSTHSGKVASRGALRFFLGARHRIAPCLVASRKHAHSERSKG